MQATQTMYRLVNQNWESFNGMSWEIGKTNRAKVDGTKMCSNQVLHCYASPDEAVLFNVIHGSIQNPILLEIECSPIVNTDGLKYATKEQTPVRVLELPKWTIEERVAFAIKLSLNFYKEEYYVAWANAWLEGKDRSAAAAAKAAAESAAESAAWAAVEAAEAAAAKAAVDAAWAAVEAAEAATDKQTFRNLVQETITWVKTEFKA